MTTRTGTRHVQPMLAKLADLPDDEDHWAFEVKWDGIRAVAFIEEDGLRLETRNLNDVTLQYPDLATLPAGLRRHLAILDGEIIALDELGRPSFQQLQSRMGLSSMATIQTRSKATPVQYMAFDLLELDGRDLRAEPYLERRRLLRALFKDTARWKVPSHHVGEGQALLDAIVAQGMEGVVAKRIDSPYREKQRGGDWRKIKLQQRQEFVIGGWTEGEGRRSGGIGSLLLGYHDEAGKLRFAGGVGTGFSDRFLVELGALLQPLERDETPFEVGLPGKDKPLGKWQAMRGRTNPSAVHFSEPRLVCEVEFTEFTRDGTLRHPSFQGLRDDKDPREVVREDA
ncbi:MAG: ligD [Thermoleophilia bacterium]|nr:ligD [Thermoleophilia bacterium]MCZ4497190.1 ligD [Thermoleophilia bacterium]